tara:strand:+ start:1538 stop:2254 length:717 start_codon:yes stop_codon:yes gene_type:complete
MDIDLNIIAIIPARGGSKRIPNKNIIDFCGKPMISWCIEELLSIKEINSVYVSTDSPEIALVAKKYGAKVPFYRTDFADDYSPVSLATVSMITNLEKKLMVKADVVIQVMPNCPLIKAKDIRAQLMNFIKLGVNNSVLSSCEYGMFNPHWAHIIKGTSNERLFPEAFKVSRSQDLPKLLCPSGAVWISESKKLLESETFYSLDYVLFEHKWESVIDIDDLGDLKLATVVHHLNSTDEN